MENTQLTPRPAFWLQYLSLFTSLGTLLCCALPSLLVLFGLGATVASVLSVAPWLVTLSRHKNWTFAIVGTLIAANFVYVRAIAPRLQAGCELGDDSCVRAARLNRMLLWVSAGIFTIGFLVAYLLGPLFVWIDNAT
jgi:mercuric ion transport protein